VISEILFSLYLENVVINCHETCYSTKSLTQQQTRTFSNIQHKPHMFEKNFPVRLI